MENKLLWFSVFLVVVMGADFLSTQYALANGAKEGNPAMASIVSNPFVFLLVKIVGTIAIIISMAWCLKKNEKITQTGMKIIGVMMLFVLANNAFVIVGSATTTFGFPDPHELESPARINIDGSTDYAFMGHNNYNVTDYFGFNTSDESGLIYTASNRFYSNNMVRYAVVDWVHPQRLFLVFSNLDVAYTDSIGTIYEDGYYAANVWPVPGCSNCNDLHKIGVLTTLNTKMSGFVDSNGDLLLGEGRSIVRFVRASDYSKVTYLTTDLVTRCTYNCWGNVYDQISSMAFDASNNLHVLVASKIDQSPSTYDNILRIENKVYSGTTLIYNNTLASVEDQTDMDLTGSTILTIASPVNASTDIVLGYKRSDQTTIYLKSFNSTASTDICPSFCATITGFNGLQIYSGYAYIASASENKIYRFPTSISVLSGSGYAPGGGCDPCASTATYSLKTISSLYSTYYNNSKIQAIFQVAYTANANQTAQIHHRIDLLSPLGVVVSSFSPITVCEEVGYWDWLLDPTKLYNCIAVSKLIDINDFITNPASALASANSISFTPATFWDNGTYTLKLHETPSDSLLASATLSVLNQSGVTRGGVPNNLGQNPNEPVDSSGILTLLQNNTFWALILTVGMMLGVGALAGKNSKDNSAPVVPMVMVGFLGLAVTTMIGWMPMWITFGTLLIVIAGFAWMQATKTNTGSQ